MPNINHTNQKGDPPMSSTEDRNEPNEQPRAIGYVIGTVPAGPGAD